MHELLIQVSPQAATNETEIRQVAAKLLGMPVADIGHVTILKRSIDARQRAIKINLKLAVYGKGEPVIDQTPKIPEYGNVANSEPVIVVGAGPAGLFAAMQLIELGLKPIVLERGKDVRGRRRDLKAINKDGIVNEDS